MDIIDSQHVKIGAHHQSKRTQAPAQGRSHRISEWSRPDLVREVLKAQEYGALILPRTAQFPEPAGIDYHIVVEPHEGCVGGDHAIVVNFEKYHLEDRIAKAISSGQDALARTLEKNRHRFGIALFDVAGHSVSENVVAMGLHMAFRTGITYELAINGEVTKRLPEILNAELYNLIQPDYLMTKPYTTMLYGEVHCDGTFRFLRAGHPAPLVYSAESGRIQLLGEDHIRGSTPLGVLPSDYRIGTEYYEPTTRFKEEYPINEIRLLNKGDILVLYSDGLSEQQGGASDFVRDRLEGVLRESHDATAKEIYQAIRSGLQAYAPPDDDLTIAIIKKT